MDLKKLVFHGGEEYEFVFTTKPAYKSAVMKSAKLLGMQIIQIGHVTNGSGVYIQENKKLEKLKDLGWKHFR